MRSLIITSVITSVIALSLSIVGNILSNFLTEELRGCFWPIVVAFTFLSILSIIFALRQRLLSELDSDVDEKEDESRSYGTAREHTKVVRVMGVAIWSYTEEEHERFYYVFGIPIWGMNLDSVFPTWATTAGVSAGLVGGLVVGSVAVYSGSGGETSDTPVVPPEIQTACGPSNLVVDSDPGAFAFQQTQLNVATNTTYTLTFQNVSGVQHNWVLVRGGDDVADIVNTEGNGVGAPNYLPEDQSNIIAATSMLDGGDCETVTFTINEPGDYRFISTYPGQYPSMVGTLSAR